MFLPQKPYFPLGTLKQAVTYPRPPTEVPDEAVREALIYVGLSSLVHRLAETDNPTLRLSGGEQQRLALARALIMKPDWLFLGEAPSDLDEEAARTLFATVQARLPQTQLVSFADHPALLALHPRRATLRSGAAGLSAPVTASVPNRDLGTQATQLASARLHPSH